jgi:hypothetical protein
MGICWISIPVFIGGRLIAVGNIGPNGVIVVLICEGVSRFKFNIEEGYGWFSAE